MNWPAGQLIRLPANSHTSLHLVNGNAELVNGREETPAVKSGWSVQRSCSLSIFQNKYCVVCIEMLDRNDASSNSCESPKRKASRTNQNPIFDVTQVVLPGNWRSEYDKQGCSQALAFVGMRVTSNRIADYVLGPHTRTVEAILNVGENNNESLCIRISFLIFVDTA